MRILVAEDDRRLADLLDQSLTEGGWDVEVAHDGRAAYGRALPDGVPTTSCSWTGCSPRWTA